MPPISKMGMLKSFQLLEINIISAQDLEPTSKKMKTYATAWVHPTRKLTTGVDVEGGNNPTWNDKFVFRVDEEFLRQDTSAVHIEIFSVHWFRDSLIGTVRVLVGNLIPPIRAYGHHNHHLGMRFVALQVCLFIPFFSSYAISWLFITNIIWLRTYVVSCMHAINWDIFFDLLYCLISFFVFFSPIYLSKCHFIFYKFVQKFQINFTPFNECDNSLTLHIMS